MTQPYPDLETPSLLFDLDVLESNLTEMAKVASDAGVRLRPHTKTHKSPEIARMQVDAGASGITVAKLGEAEVMLDGGMTDILVAFPLWGENKLRRLRDLAERASMRVSLDSVEVAEGIGRLGSELGRDVSVLVEVDTGLHRMGRPAGAPTAELSLAIARVPGVEVVGLLTHAGQAYRSTTPDELRRVAEREALDLLETAELCARQGLEIAEISVGSTPTARVVANVPGVTEIRPGTYVFNDVQQMRLGGATEAACAARVLVTVVARPSAERFVLDAGTKVFSSDGGDGPPFPGRGVVVGRPDLRIDFMNEEHGVGHVEGGAELAIGERLEVIPLHVCATVNMFDDAAGVRNGAVEREIRISGRGRFPVTSGLADKGVLISGGTSGIGLATARRFLEEGARVVVSGMTEEEVEIALKELSVGGSPAGSPQGVAADVADADAVREMAARAEEALGRIDVLINNAGIARKSAFLDTDVDAWDRTIAVNLRGMFLLAQDVARRMVADGGGGSIVNMASTNALGGEQDFADYNASKGGVLQLTRTMAVELGPLGVRVNCVCPGFIDTPLNRALGSEQDFRAYERDRIPLGRRGTAEEVASVYAFLASDEASFVHGAAIVVDGGQTAVM